MILLVLCVGCDDPAPSVDPAPESTAPTAEPAPSTTAPTPTPSEVTTGFIEAKVDGAPMRYEHLPANDNRVFTRVTKMTAHASAESEEGFELLLNGFDVRTLEMPAVIRGGMRDAVRGNLAAAMRMPALKYRDADGNRYITVFNDDSLECQSLEDLVLTCTFSGTLNGDAGSVEITEGRLQVKLGTDELADSMLEGSVGMAADESLERVQEVIDRRRGMR